MSTGYPIERDDRRRTFTVTAGQSVFGPFTFKIWDAADIVFETRASTALPWQRQSAFTVALTGAPPSQFTITKTGLATGLLCRVKGARIPERETDATRAGAISATALEADLDRINTTEQELRRDADAALFPLADYGNAGDLVTRGANGELIGIPMPAPGALDGAAYLRRDGSTPMTAELPLVGNAVQPLGAVTLQQAEALAAAASATAIAAAAAAVPAIVNPLVAAGLAGASGFDGRMTLVQSEPYSIADVAMATSLWIEPVGPRKIGIWDGAAWVAQDFAPAELKATAVLAGTITSGSANVTGIASTKGLVVGMNVAGNGIAGGTTILAITGASTLTLSANASATGAHTLTFRLAANTNYDVFAAWNASGATIEFAWGPAWTSDMLRSAAIGYRDGIAVLAADNTRRLIGTVRVIEFPGYLSDTPARRYVSNLYNRQRRSLKVLASAAAWNPLVQNSWEVAANVTDHAVRYVAASPRDVEIEAHLSGVYGAALGSVAYFATGIGIDRTDTDYSEIRQPGILLTTAGIPSTARAKLIGDFGEGYHAAFWLTRATGLGAVGSMTFYGTGQSTSLQDFIQSGLIGSIDQ